MFVWVRLPPVAPQGEKHMSFVATKMGKPTVIKDCFQCPSLLHNMETVENGEKITATICSELMRNVIKHKGNESKLDLFYLFWEEHGKDACFPAWCPRRTGKSRESLEKLRGVQENDFVSTF
jgi:hypothetical protein